MDTIGRFAVLACLVLANVAETARQRHNYDIRYDGLRTIEGVPTCDPNCTYFSSLNKKLMACHIDDCKDVMTTKESVASPPDIKRNQLSFLKHTDPESGEPKLALSVKFSPADNISIKHTTGYLVRIHDGQTSYKRCYRFNGMNYTENKKDIFHDACFRPTQQNMTLFSSIYVSISSLPFDPRSPSGAAKTFVIKFPSVPDRDTVSRGEIVDIYCHNSSLRYVYAVGPSYGDGASVTICEEDESGSCNGGFRMIESGLNLTGSLVLEIPSENNRYQIVLSASDSARRLNVTRVDFSNCRTALHARLLPPIIVASLFLCVVPAVCRFVYVRRQKKRARKGHVPISSEDSIEASDAGSQESSVDDSPVPSRKIFVLSKDGGDNDVVVSFCTYLQSCFGQAVTTHLWDEEFVGSPWAFVVENIRCSDEVVVICSTETKKGNLPEEDPFARGVKLVRDQASMPGNESKFSICYFSPDSSDCIPEDLSLMKRHHYKLMDDFETFFFHAIDTEKYQQGKILDFDEFRSTNPLRQDLEDSIEKRRLSRQRETDPLPSTPSSISSSPESIRCVAVPPLVDQRNQAGCLLVDTVAEVHSVL